MKRFVRGAGRAFTRWLEEGDWLFSAIAVAGAIVVVLILA